MATISQSAVLRYRIRLRGIVQGVGFRPFIYKLATRLRVGGFILNSSSGITIEAEGSDSAIEQFLSALRSHPPRLAQIGEITSEELQPTGESRFEIRESLAADGEFALVSGDVATCVDCLRDVSDPANRRFGYPFTNCTNCGPRYSIIRNIPYDRSTTTMASFTMCVDCEAEYHDPMDRRFHAQPNACPVCGPRIFLAKGRALSPLTSSHNYPVSSRSPLSDVRRALHEGAIVAIKGLGGFQLACNAQNDSAIRILRHRKRRSDKPFALMVRELEQVEKICRCSPADRELLLSPERPIVILPRRPSSQISSEIAPGNHTIGVMLAYTPLHFMLFGNRRDTAPEFNALVMTSGNISEEPIVISNKEAWEHLSGIADCFLFHNRDIHMRVDDSVAQTFEGRSRVLRRSRGYAPQPIDLGAPLCEVLACGADLKNAFCLTKGQYAIMSQHIGDIENYETLEFFQETLANLKKLFRVEPQAVVHDLHPCYVTSRFAAKQPLPTIAVQHHHAHIVSCMAENHLSGKVIGVAFDGTGYGTDGEIWGGEFLVAGLGTFERRAHFRYVPLPGGDTAVRQGWRSALSWLRESFSSNIPGDLPLFEQVSERDIAIASRMIDHGVNTVRTSSCGRLFDAVASIIGIRQQSTFEGQAAIELEMLAQEGTQDHYPFEITATAPAEIDMRPAIREIAGELHSNRSKPGIASRFHNTIVSIIEEVCCRIRKSDHLGRVCLSGGTFQNRYLLKRVAESLRRRSFEVFLHSQVPPNDGGISLGQAVIANQILNRGA
jgi:hydrogenase maturation protein HypF